MLFIIEGAAAIEALKGEKYLGNSLEAESGDYPSENAFQFWTNGSVRKFYSPALFPWECRTENHHMVFMFRESRQWEIIEEE